MTRTTLLGIAFAAVALSGGCGRSDKSAETTAPLAAGPAAMPADAPANAADANALIEDNDRAIADNKRMTATLARYQSEDFGKYERLRKACETQAHGTLADSAAPAVARCIEAGW